MRFVPSLSMKLKLVSGFGAIVLLLVTVITTAYVALEESQVSQRKMLEDNFGNLYDLPTLRSNMNAQRLAIAMMLELDRAQWGPWQEEISRRRKVADDIVNNLIMRFRANPGESEKLGAFIVLREAYERAQDTELTLLVDQGKIEESRNLFLGTQMKNHAQLRALLGELEAMELTEARAMVKETEINAQSRTRAFVIFGGLGVLVAVALALFMSRTISSYVLELKSGSAALARANRSLKMLNKCNSTAIHATDEPGLLEDICRVIVDVGGYKMAWVGYADDDKNKTVRPMAFAGDGGDYIEHANISWSDSERGHGPTGTAIRTGEIVIARDTSTEPGYEPWRYRAREKGYRSSITLPLKDGDRVYGALMVYSTTPDPFDEEETRLLSEMAEDTAFATVALRVQNARVQAERKAREAASYSRTLLEASPDPMVAISPSGKITDVNKATEEATGNARAVLIGTNFADYFIDPIKANAALQETLVKGSIHNYPLVMRNSSGESIGLLCNASVYRNEDGEMQGVFGVARYVRHAGVARGAESTPDEERV
jgi:PAS domain S-box-containing protein